MLREAPIAAIVVAVLLVALFVRVVLGTRRWPRRLDPPGRTPDQPVPGNDAPTTGPGSD